MDVISPDADRRVAVRRAFVRTMAGVIGLLVAYAVAPLEVRADWPFVRTALGIALLTVVVAWQLRTISGAAHPRNRAACVVGLAAAMSAIGFAAGYLVTSTADPAAFSEPLNHVDALYFSLTVLSTVGFGDIHAVSSAARVLVMLHIVVNIAVITVATRMAFALAGRATEARDHR